MSNDDDMVSNPTDNETFEDVIDVRLSRRGVLGGGLAVAAASALGGIESIVQAVPAAADDEDHDDDRHRPRPLLGFGGIPVSTLDEVVVPGLHRPPADPVGRSRLPPSRLSAGRVELGGRTGQAVGHAQRRRRVLPDGRLAPRPARAEQRVHRRRAAVHRRRGWLDRREDGQVAERPRRVHHRDQATSSRRLAGGATLQVRPPHHCELTDPHRRSGGGRRAPVHERGSHRQAGARHVQQLRHGLHTMGHLPRLRGELQRVLPQDGGATPAEARYGINAVS